MDRDEHERAFELEGDEAREAAEQLRVALADPQGLGPERLVEVVEALEACPTASLVALRVLTPDGVAAPGADELCEALLVAVNQPAHQARVHWMRALVAEAEGDLAAAEAHLEAGLRANRQAADVVDRLAWYRSDRGDAAGALGLWRSIGWTPDDDPEVHVVAGVVASGGADKLGRNDPCWCGSGRKYKQCHLGEVAQPALPDRVRWLITKAEGHVRRGGIGGVEEVMDLAAVLAGADADDPQALVGAMGHPLVVSLVLEHGGLARFVAARGPLLPDDEQLLATSWLTTGRSVHEVEEVHAGDGVVLRDLRTGDRHDVRDVAYSGQARVGQVILAWVVPDGQRHQLLPGAVFVDPSSIDELIALLDDDDPEGIVAWLQRRPRPPRLSTPDPNDVAMGLRAARLRPVLDLDG